jgi:anti-sigma regulatory factor (Ser/Thr protein kinase)
LSSERVAPYEPSHAFRHEALMYAGMDEFVDGVTAFLREGLACDEPALVVVGAEKIARLQEALGADADRVCFADMTEVGANPARIIPAWHEFVAQHAPSRRPFRGVGEPIWAARSPEELAECQRHEALLNVAFDDSADWVLLCPYDTTTLTSDVLEEAERSHRFVATVADRSPSRRYGVDDGLEVFAGALPEPSGPVAELHFAAGPLRAVRQFVYAHPLVERLDRARIGDLLVAVTELASNSIRHGGGAGTVRVWGEQDAIVCEMRDSGRLADPLVGRQRPTVDRRDGRGVWLVHQLCDLVQIRSSHAGTTVRIHMRLSDAAR